MSTAAGILAGNAYVRFGVDDDAVSPGLAKVEAKLRSFGAGAGGTADKIGASMGKTLSKGIVGFFGVQMADRMLGGLADAMEASAKGGAFKGVGEIIGDSLREGIQSVPIAGSIERIAEAFGNKLWGVDPDIENKIASSREEAARNNDRVREEEERKDRERKESAKKALEEANQLYSGLMADYAEQGGALDPQARKTDEQIGKLTGLLNAAGLGGMANSAADAIREKAGWAAASKKSIDDWNERQKDIESVLSRLQKSASDYGLSEDELALKQLRDSGASTDQIAAAERAIGVRKLLEAMDDPSNSYDPGAIMQETAQAMPTVMSSVGTFSSRMLDDLAQTSPAMKLQEKIVENTKRTAVALERGAAPVFGS